MPKTLSAEELAKLEAGDETGEPNEPEFIDEPEDEDEDEGDDNDEIVAPAPDKPAPKNEAVPYDRFQEQVAETSRLRDMLSNLTEVVKQTQARSSPPAPARPTYTRTDDAPDKRAWREFVGETVEPVVAAKLADIEAQNRQSQLAIAETLDDQKARAMFSDYGDYEADINQLRQNFYANTQIAVPREYAYYVASSIRTRAKQGSATRNKAVKRASPAAAGESAPPAKAGSKTQIRLTPANVKDMSLKQMEAYLTKKNPRI